MNTLSTGIQVSAAEIATDTLVVNKNSSDESGFVDTVEEGKVVDKDTDATEEDESMDDVTEEKGDSIGEKAFRNLWGEC